MTRTLLATATLAALLAVHLYMRRDGGVVDSFRVWEGQ